MARKTLEPCSRAVSATIEPTLPVGPDTITLADMQWTFNGNKKKFRSWWNIETCVEAFLCMTLRIVSLASYDLKLPHLKLPHPRFSTYGHMYQLHPRNPVLSNVEPNVRSTPERCSPFGIIGRLGKEQKA
jgi:hypothetical protein